MTDPTRISDDQHNNAPAVPQGWTKAADQVPLEADGEVFIRFTDGSIGTGWATYWHGASNEFAQWTFPDPDEDRTVLEWTKNPATPAPAPAPAQGEPFGYFRAEPFGWTDCAKDAEGAIALYEHPAKPAQEVSDKHEREMLEVIDERDRIHEWADQLADAIAKHTGYEIGEHTSGNNPWRMALNALVCHQACHEAKPAQEVGLTDRQFDLICQAIDKADTVTMDGDYMLDSDDCIRVVRVMQVLFDIAALRAKGGK